MTEGIITGVIASAIFLGITLAIKQWLWPRFMSALYKGTKIDGEWDGYFEGSNEVAVTIKFKQCGTKLVGTSVVSKNRKGESVDRRYKYKGTFLNRSIVLTFEDERNPLMMGGAMVFHHIDSDAKQMKGKSMYFKPEINDVDVTNALLKKKSS